MGLKAIPAQCCALVPPPFTSFTHPHHLPRPLPSFLLSAESAIKGGPAGLQKLLKETSGQLQRLAGSDSTGATPLQLNKQVGGGGGARGEG